MLLVGLLLGCLSSFILYSLVAWYIIPFWLVDYYSYFVWWLSFWCLGLLVLVLVVWSIAICMCILLFICSGAIARIPYGPSIYWECADDVVLLYNESVLMILMLSVVVCYFVGWSATLLMCWSNWAVVLVCCCWIYYCSWLLVLLLLEMPSVCWCTAGCWHIQPMLSGLCSDGMFAAVLMWKCPSCSLLTIVLGGWFISMPGCCLLSSGSAIVLWLLLSGCLGDDLNLPSWMMLMTPAWCCLQR